jgi:hypothetical protein
LPAKTLPVVFDASYFSVENPLEYLKSNVVSALVEHKCLPILPFGVFSNIHSRILFNNVLDGMSPTIESIMECCEVVVKAVNFFRKPHLLPSEISRSETVGYSPLHAICKPIGNLAMKLSRDYNIGISPSLALAHSIEYEAFHIYRGAFYNESTRARIETVLAQFDLMCLNIIDPF